MSSEYVCRLWRSKLSVTGPLCGGSVMRMPAAGSTPLITSQKDRPLVTPTPSSAGQTMRAGSRVGGAAGAAGLAGGLAGVGLRVCAVAGIDSAMTKTNVAAMAPMERPYSSPTQAKPADVVSVTG